MTVGTAIGITSLEVKFGTSVARHEYRRIHLYGPIDWKTEITLRKIYITVFSFFVVFRNKMLREEVCVTDKTIIL